MAHFLFLAMGEKEREEGESTNLLSSIYETPLVGFRRVNDKSSSHRRGVRVGT